MLVKKYANRRLYDTEESRYITLEERADKIRAGSDATVVDAATGDDLTQATFAQLILESRGGAKLLPVPLLTQLIRMGDDALAEFMGRTLSASLDLYIQAKQGAAAMAAFNPFAAQNPFIAQNPFARFFGGPAPQPSYAQPSYTQAAPPPPPPPSRDGEDVREIRRELDELKRAVRGAAAAPVKAAKKRARSPSR